MSRAIQLARKGLYTTHPNPRVGCVLVKDSQIVGEGWHLRAGEAHAEINALADAGERAAGATAYVTLEPCSHHGRTPPCADALIQAKVDSVVVAMEDPNPKVAGKGLQKLRQAGVNIKSGVLQSQAESLNPGFIKRMKFGLPWVRVKLAASLDGCTAMASGESVWISGEHSRRDVQFQRAQASCILTGSGTVLHDNPSLNVRLTAEDLGFAGEIRQPVRVVLDTALRIPDSARVFQIDQNYLVYTNSCKNNTLNNIIKLDYEKNNPNKIVLLNLLNDLAKREFNEVHVEAGPVLCGALLSQQLVDEVVLYCAPHVMGDSGKPLFHLPGIETMSERIPFDIKEVRMVGKDIRLVLIPA